MKLRNWRSQKVAAASKRKPAIDPETIRADAINHLMTVRGMTREAAEREYERRILRK